MGVITRSLRWPKFVWATGGAALVVICKLLPPAAAWAGVLKGRDIYLFLIGTMGLAEVARREGLFDWLAGLLAGAAVHAAHVSDNVSGAILIGVDLGPNLSVTGSLATIRWLTAIRHEGEGEGEGEDVSSWTFLKLGCLAMPPALAGLLLVP